MDTLDLILERFEQISLIPRISKQEAQLCQWLQDWATELGFSSKTDKAGNLVIYIPPTLGLENAPTIILQGHMDMVAQKTPDSKHDFLRDPIRIIRDGDWLKADRTTLGADNGIAIAMAMALVEDESVTHPPLELLFTVEEEVGLGGADYLDPGLLSGKVLLNLDSEDEGSFTVGCAGGGGVSIHLKVGWESLPANCETFYLKVNGLQGGHSGGDIHKHRGNSNKIISRVLDNIQKDVPIQLAALKGGTVRNAIPREAEAVLACPKGMSTICSERFASIAGTVKNEYSRTDGGLNLSFEKGKNVTSVVNRNDSGQIIKLMVALPNGVAEMAAGVNDSVETSNNVGIVELKEDGLHVISSQRSSVLSRLEEITQRVDTIARLAGAQTELTKMSKPWQPDMNSSLLKKCLQIYETQFKQKPKVEIIHGGLECGIINERCGGMDSISFGPTIFNPHSPDEKLFIPTIMRVWDFLTALLKSY
ncbi:MAG: aminoacyl-histidine dipeptidase [Anaerolineales bacterium]|nr:aminoacyl-histidine dipeptidase [Anaerolineales bacterium]